MSFALVDFYGVFGNFADKAVAFVDAATPEAAIVSFEGLRLSDAFKRVAINVF